MPLVTRRVTTAAHTVTVTILHCFSVYNVASAVKMTGKEHWRMKKLRTMMASDYLSGEKKDETE